MKTSKRQAQRFYGLPNGTKLRRTHNNKIIYKLDQENQQLTKTTTAGVVLEILETDETDRVSATRDLLKKHTQDLAYNGELAVGGTSTVDFVDPIPEDIVAPDAPTVSVSEDSPYTVSGTTEIGATLTIYLDDVSQGSVSAAGDGSYSFDFDDPELIAEGMHTVTVSATDTANNVSELGSDTFTVPPLSVREPTEGELYDGTTSTQIYENYWKSDTGNGVTEIYFGSATPIIVNDAGITSHSVGGYTYYKGTLMSNQGSYTEHGIYRTAP